MIEIYKDIPNYEGSYQVSNYGNVKSLPKSDGNGNQERLLKQENVKASHTNYSRVTLSLKGKTKRFQVHRLVALTFLPNPDNKPHVNHIDNNGKNNHVSNLEWCTHIENMQHSASQNRQHLPHHLGGKATGELQHQKSLVEGKACIGTTKGSLTIIDYIYDITLKRPRFKFVCICTCGNRLSRNKYDFEHKPQMCNECSYKQRSVDNDIVSTA